MGDGFGAKKSMLGSVDDAHHRIPATVSEPSEECKILPHLLLEAQSTSNFAEGESHQRNLASAQVTNMIENYRNHVRQQKKQSSGNGKSIAHRTSQPMETKYGNQKYVNVASMSHSQPCLYTVIGDRKTESMHHTHSSDPHDENAGNGGESVRKISVGVENRLRNEVGHLRQQVQHLQRQNDRLKQLESAHRRIEVEFEQMTAQREKHEQLERNALHVLETQLHRLGQQNDAYRRDNERLRATVAALETQVVVGSVANEVPPQQQNPTQQQFASELECGPTEGREKTQAQQMQQNDFAAGQARASIELTHDGVPAEDAGAHVAQPTAMQMGSAQAGASAQAQAQTQSQQQQQQQQQMLQMNAILSDLVPQNHELRAAKERQRVELDAQRTTLEEQRTHIDMLEKALTNAQERLAAKDRQALDAVAVIDKCEHMQKLLQEALDEKQRNSEEHARQRAQLEMELAQLRVQATKQDHLSSALGGVRKSGGGADAEEALQKLKKTLHAKEDRIVQLETSLLDAQRRYNEALKKEADAELLQEKVRLLESENDLKDHEITVLTEEKDRIHNQWTDERRLLDHRVRLLERDLRAIVNASNGIAFTTVPPMGANPLSAYYPTNGAVKRYGTGCWSSSFVSGAYRNNAEPEEVYDRNSTRNANRKRGDYYDNRETGPESADANGFESASTSPLPLPGHDATMSRMEELKRKIAERRAGIQNADAHQSGITGRDFNEGEKSSQTSRNNSSLSLYDRDELLMRSDGNFKCQSASYRNRGAKCASHCASTRIISMAPQVDASAGATTADSVVVKNTVNYSNTVENLSTINTTKNAPDYSNITINFVEFEPKIDLNDYRNNNNVSKSKNSNYDITALYGSRGLNDGENNNTVNV